MSPRTGSTWENPRVFPSRAAFRRWLEKNHDGVDELWVGFYKKATGKMAMTYSEAVDESLCWGWIDGIKRRVDDERYTNRFTPRKPKSKWSEVNLRRYAELVAEGSVAAPGRAAFERFDAAEHTPYSFEARREAFRPSSAKRFRADRKAWAFFQDQPPGYRRTCIHWVESARREETRTRRLARLMDFSAAGERVPEISGGPARRKP